MTNLDTSYEAENTNEPIDAELNQDIVVEQPEVEASTPDTLTDDVTNEGTAPVVDELPTGIKKRFAKMTKEKYAMQQELDALRNQVTSLGKKPEPEYTREDFGSDEEAYINYKVEQGINKQLETTATKQNEAYQAQSAQEQFQSEFKSKVDSFAEELPDYVNVVANAEIEYTPDEVQVIMESPIGPKIAYVMATNDTLADQFQALPSQRARDRFLMKLENQLETPIAIKPRTPASAKPVSSAPKPAPKLNAGKGSSNVDPSTMSMEQYTAWRNSQ